MLTRRSILMATAAAGVAALVAGTSAPVMAQDGPIQVGLIGPLSGPWARQGELMVKGAELAIKDINDAGGIKALNGRPLELVIFDAGESVQTATNAAQRMVSEYPNLVAVTGSWLSSFTLAVSEVTERAQLPMITLSYSDQITGRGFDYIFQMPKTGGAQAREAVPSLMQLAEAATGEKPDRAGMIGDNTASSVSFVTPLREGLMKELGIEVLFDETWTPPLADATALIQQARSTRPDFMIMASTAVPDNKLLLEKVNEFNLGGGRMPIIGSGAHLGTPELLNNVGADLVEGVMTVVGNWPGKGQEELVARFKETTGEPWMTQDSISTYGDIQLMAYALEQAGEASRSAVAEALRNTNTTEGPAAFYPGGKIEFNEAGLNVGAALVIVQWQNGEPVSVFPPETAMAEPIWPTN
jgi:branched-chain amino acid transport system substrate-binding protein